MASIKATAFNNPKFMAGDGCSTAYIDTASLTTGLTVGDTVEFAIPAGAQVYGLEFDADDLDSNGTPLLTFKAGYKSIAAEPTLTTNDSYFGTGLQIGRAAGRSSMAFKPITFNEPVAIFLTVTAAAATAAAGKICAIAKSNCVGVK